MLALNMPPGSMVWQEMGLDQAWTVEAHLLADAVDALHAANWQRGDGKGDKPKPMPRPSELRDLREKREASLARASRFLKRTEGKD